MFRRVEHLLDGCMVISIALIGAFSYVIFAN
jgi:hypothetical protein